MSQKKLFKDKYVGYHTFGLGVDGTKQLEGTNGYEYVDLGLPSGTLWAKYNIGSKSITDPGLYFAWGETIGYTPEQIPLMREFTQDQYKFFTQKGSPYSKYDDNKVQLDPEDNAAHVIMGGKWTMPTQEQFEELFTLETNFARVDSVDNQGNNISIIVANFISNNDSEVVLSIPIIGYYVENSLEEKLSRTRLTYLHTLDLNNKNSQEMQSSYDFVAADIQYHSANPSMGLPARIVPLINTIPRYYGCNIRGVINTK